MNPAPQVGDIVQAVSTDAPSQKVKIVKIEDRPFGLDYLGKPVGNPDAKGFWYSLGELSPA